MRKSIKIFRQYSLRGAFTLLWALMIDKLYQRIPKQVFYTNNIYNQLYQLRADFRREKSEAVIVLDNVEYRLRTEGSDFQVFDQIILGRGLAKVIELIREQTFEGPLRIMDCGANIGLSTLVFKHEFPGAGIIAVEPEGTNFHQLAAHIRNNKLANVTPVKMGVWSKKTTLAADPNFRDGKNWSFAVTKNESVSGVQVDTIANIAVAAGWPGVDVLKIDIEGSEFELFEKTETWQRCLDSVKVISIEVHEELGDAAAIENVLVRNGFKLHRYQELLIGTRA